VDSLNEMVLIMGLSKSKKYAVVIIIICFVAVYFTFFFPKAPKQEEEIEPLYAAEEYIMSLRNPDGGFGADPKTGNSTIESTAYAVLALKELGRLKALNRTILQGIYNFTYQQQRWDGGFGNDITYEYSTLYHTWLAVSCLNTFNRSYLLNDQYLGSYFVGEFYEDGSAGDIVSTFYAISGLKMMNVSENIFEKYTYNTEFFLKNLYVYPGGFSPIYFEYKQYVYSTYFALMLMMELGLYETEIDQDIISNSSRWIAECFDETTGGFGNTKGRTPSIDVTYWATKTLNITKQMVGASQYFEKEATENYIWACQRDDGGFVKSPSDDGSSSIEWTYYALASLNQVHPISEIRNLTTTITKLRLSVLLPLVILASWLFMRPDRPFRRPEKKSTPSPPTTPSRPHSEDIFHHCERCGTVVRNGKLYECENCGKLVCEKHTSNCGCNFPSPVLYLIIHNSKIKKKMKNRKGGQETRKKRRNTNGV